MHARTHTYTHTYIHTHSDSPIHAQLHVHQLSYTSAAAWAAGSSLFRSPSNVVSQRRAVHQVTSVPCCCLKLQGYFTAKWRHNTENLLTVHLYGTSLSNVTPSSNTARPAVGLEGGGSGASGEVMLWPKGGQRRMWDTGREGDATGHLVERLVGSEAVGGGGGPRRSRSSM